MVRCENCLNFFEVEDLGYTFVADESNGYSNLKRRCPKCRSVEFVDAKRCPRCGKNHVDDCDFCENCQTELKNELQNFLNKYSPEEQEVMFF